MIYILIPQNKGRNKSSIRGFWKADNGKIYYDYLRLTTGKIEYLEYYKIHYKQEAIFYHNGNIGYCYYSKDKTVILPHRIYTEVKREDLKGAIKAALAQYSGCTVYIVGKAYYIEIFTTI